ncbi:MAG TPA: hypothetical protein VGE98_02660 [Thermoanaerobaculia bacterium]
MNGVYRVVPGANRGFVLAWKLASAASPEALPSTGAPADSAAWPSYPLLPPAAGGAIEGYVDVRRFGAGAAGCVGLVLDEEVAAATRITDELAPSGPSALYLDGALVFAAGGGSGAVLGQGATLPLSLERGRHRLFVRTCPDGGTPAHVGFYLLERNRRPA